MRKITTACKNERKITEEEEEEEKNIFERHALPL